MKKLAFILAVILVVSMPINAFAASRALVSKPQLSFSGSTAICELTVAGNCTSEHIEINLKLMYGDTCIASWYGHGYGYVYMNKTKTVTTGRTYKLIAEITVNGVIKDPVYVTATC